MSLRRKLLLALLIPALLIGLVGGVGVLSVRHLEQAAGRILADNYRSIQAARRMERALRQLDLLAATRGCAADAATTAARERLAATFEAALRACEANVTEEGEHVVLARIRERWVALERQRDGAPGVPAAPCAPGPATVLLHEAIDELAALNERAMFSEEARTREVAGVMSASVAGFLLAALAALGIFAVLSARRIAQPVSQVADRLHQALNPGGPGDDAPAPDGVPADEIGRLRTEFEALLARLAHYEDEQRRRVGHLQEQLALVMNEVREGLVLLDAGLRVVAANRVGRRILGTEELEGQRLGGLAASEAVREALAPLAEGTLRGERDLGELTCETEGGPRVYRPRALPLLEAGGLEGHLLLFWDVTEQRELEESRRRFIAMLSHELKTPMTSLSLAVGLLREQLPALEKPQRELLEIARESCGSLSRLVSDLIEAARDATPDLSLRPRPLDLARLVRYALRPLQAQAQEKGLTLVVPDERTRLTASVDPVKFPWIITNIAGNAVRYTARGGRIEVALRDDEASIELSIRDTGSGIPAADLERIFEPYVSLESEPQAGTHGLGLAIAREIVAAHGGTITAESQLGAGTTFRIRLPRAGGGGTR
jgi:signal transduction histidine kinase/HAMP domain-containing protein